MLQVKGMKDENFWGEFVEKLEQRWANLFGSGATSTFKN